MLAYVHSVTCSRDVQPIIAANEIINKGARIGGYEESSDGIESRCEDSGSLGQSRYISADL